MWRAVPVNRNDRRRESIIQKIYNSKYKPYTLRNLDEIKPMERLPGSLVRQIRAVARVLPFRANNYVVNELIDWDNVPEDPIFQLTFPQPGMLSEEDLSTLTAMDATQAGSIALQHEARRIQMEMNPHPAGQMELNVPTINGRRLEGLQHKYKETVLVFPRQGQTCHAFCTYCFRWAQFCGVDKLRFECSDPQVLPEYLTAHPEVSDILFTGGDPMVMRAKVMRPYIEALLKHQTARPLTIRFGTKALAYWPYRFLTDKDADELMQLFEKIVAAGHQLAIMAHFSHDRELETPAVAQAVRRLQSVGAVIRCQGPLVRHVNDSADVWARMWRRQIRLGAIPYYMFVARNTGPKDYFKVPLARSYQIFSEAYGQVSGLGRTVRGPSMSATPGKIVVDGIATIRGEKVFVLKFIQGREPSWVNRVFFARYTTRAAWIDELEPAFGEREFFFESGLERIKTEKAFDDMPQPGPFPRIGSSMRAASQQRFIH